MMLQQCCKFCCLQMADLEETFVAQLQKVADTFKRQLADQQAKQANLEGLLAQAEAALMDAQKELQASKAAYDDLQMHPPPVSQRV